MTAVSQTAIRAMPPGTQPPLVIRYSASSVPILQISLNSDTFPEQRIFDLAVNQLRPQLVMIPGVQIPWPYGGKQRQIMVDIDPDKLYAWGISPNDVSNAINAQNLILPAGTAKIGKQEYQVRLNSSPEVVATLNDLPIKTVNGTTVCIKDVAQVRDGFSVQTNVVNSNGRRGILLSIYKLGTASTLDIVKSIREALPRIEKTLPPDLKINLLFDQSVFVRASVEGVVKEAAIAAGLTGLMILLFLGSWRSTLIVIISIPLSILVSIIILGVLGQTLNVMTLGGMALAVGILVDDATVEIENIHRNLHQKKRLVKAILDGAQQIAMPAFVSTLCICIVFVPVVFISGAAKYLFTPLAMAVVFAMMTSYLLSRTLVPTMVHYLLAGEVEMYGGEIDLHDPHAMKAMHHREEMHDRPHQGMLARPWFRLLLLVIAAAIGGVIYLETQGLLHVPVAWLMSKWAALEQWATHNPPRPGPVDSARGLWALLLYLLLRYHLFWRIHRRSTTALRGCADFYGGLLAWALGHRLFVVAGFVVLVGGSCGLLRLVGEDFFPSVDAGLIRLHVRARPARASRRRPGTTRKSRK